MIRITPHALHRARQRGIKEPTPAHAFRALRRGKRLAEIDGRLGDAYEWRGVVWVFSRCRTALATIYRKEWSDDRPRPKIAD